MAKSSACCCLGDKLGSLHALAHCAIELHCTTSTPLDRHQRICCPVQDTLDKMIRSFGAKGKLKGARNYCEVSQINHTTCTNTGAPQPPGGDCLATHPL